MNEFACVGVVASASFTTLAAGAFGAMAVPYFENAPYLTDLRKHPHLATLIGIGLFLVFFAIFYLGALYLDENTSGPLLLFTGFVVSMPLSLWLGSETWDRHNGHGMNTVSAVRAVVVAALALVLICLYEVTISAISRRRSAKEVK